MRILRAETDASKLKKMRTSFNNSFYRFSTTSDVESDRYTGSLSEGESKMLNLSVTKSLSKITLLVITLAIMLTIISCKNDNLVSPEEIIHLVRHDCGNGKWGFRDTTTGEIVVPCIYDFVQDFIEGFAGVKLGGKYGFIDKTGKVVIPIIYDRILYFSEGLAAVGIGDYTKEKWGFVDKTGKVVIPIIYDAAFYFIEGLAIVRDGKFGFIDKTGKVVVPCIYDFVNNFSEGFARVSIGEVFINLKHGLVDKTGKVVVPIIYDYVATFFREGLVIVGNGNSANRKYGFVDVKTGKEVVPIIYDAVFDFHEGLARVRTGPQKWGFVDKTGKEVVPIIYDIVNDFREGLARVGIGYSGNRKYGFVDKTGKEAIPLMYFEASDFGQDFNGKARVWLRLEDGTSRTFCINKQNVEVPCN